MSIEDFIIAVFCLIDDELEKMLKDQKIRQRGPRPTLQDSEVITMEIVGEVLRKDSDKAIWEYFKGHSLRRFVLEMYGIKPLDFGENYWHTPPVLK